VFYNIDSKRRRAIPAVKGLIKELNLWWRVYVEIPKPSRVELIFSDTREGFGIAT
jgi:hypothetical protein